MYDNTCMLMRVYHSVHIVCIQLYLYVRVQWDEGVYDLCAVFPFVWHLLLFIIKICTSFKTAYQFALTKRHVRYSAQQCLIDGTTALYYAAQQGLLKVAEILLDRGADIEARNEVIGSELR